MSMLGILRKYVYQFIVTPTTAGNEVTTVVYVVSLAAFSLWDVAEESVPTYRQSSESRSPVSLVYLLKSH